MPELVQASWSLRSTLGSGKSLADLGFGGSWRVVSSGKAIWSYWVHLGSSECQSEYFLILEFQNIISEKYFLCILGFVEPKVIQNEPKNAQSHPRLDKVRVIRSTRCF